MIKDFTELKSHYRVRIDSLDKQFVSWISNKTFESYEEAWNYGVQESKQFGNCGVRVIYAQEPELSLQGLQLNGCEFPQCDTCNLEDCIGRQGK